jgi:twitching motility protein PilU
MDLSLNMRALLSQRLVRKEGGGRCAAMEILLNTPHVADMIFKGKVGELKEVMARGNEQGMITFDQSLFKLFEAGEIDYGEALRHADSQNELRLNIKLNSKRVRKDLRDDADVNALSVHDDEEDEAADEGMYRDER